jgi:hypothetical protein
MADFADKIGVIRKHRWISAEEQAERLRSRCRLVVSLGGGRAKTVTLEDVERLVRPGTVVELVHAFLLVDPIRKYVRGGMKADFRVALSLLEKRGATVVDVDAQVCSGKQRKALLALVDSDISRSNRGARSATNGSRSKGRPTYEPTRDELRAAKAIWRDLIEYREWSDADKALRTQVNRKFTAWRAYKLWHGRNPQLR